jgi:hypothetical protein
MVGRLHVGRSLQQHLSMFHVAGGVSWCSSAFGTTWRLHAEQARSCICMHIM